MTEQFHELPLGLLDELPDLPYERVDMPRYIDLYLDGRLKLDELVSRRITLDEVNDGFDAMKAGEVARSVIVY